MPSNSSLNRAGLLVSLVSVFALAVAGMIAPLPARAAAGDVSIFGTAVPASPSSADSAAVELGVTFIPRVSGSVVGIRFYKGSGNTGIHTGSLWTSSGTRLATATFTNETATGWQTVTLATPVNVSAGQRYVASYYAPRGATRSRSASSVARTPAVTSLCPPRAACIAMAPPASRGPPTGPATTTSTSCSDRPPPHRLPPPLRRRRRVHRLRRFRRPPQPRFRLPRPPRSRPLLQRLRATRPASTRGIPAVRSPCPPASVWRT